MKIYLNEIANKIQRYEEDILLDTSNISSYNFVSLDKVNVKVDVCKISDDLINLNLKILTHAKMLTNIHLNKVDYKININENIIFTLDKQYEDGDIIYLDENYIDIDQLVYSYVVSELPSSIKEEKFDTIEKDNYRIISEDQYQKEHQKRKSSPFDKLKDLDLE